MNKPTFLFLFLLSAVLTAPVPEDFPGIWTMAGSIGFCSLFGTPNTDVYIQESSDTIYLYGHFSQNPHTMQYSADLSDIYSGPVTFTVNPFDNLDVVATDITFSIMNLTSADMWNSDSDESGNECIVTKTNRTMFNMTGTWTSYISGPSDCGSPGVINITQNGNAVTLENAWGQGDVSVYIFTDNRLYAFPQATISTTDTPVTNGVFTIFGSLGLCEYTFVSGVQPLDTYSASLWSGYSFIVTMIFGIIALITI